MFNKKAMAAEQIITVLFVLVAFAALLVYVNYSAKPAISQTADDSACALSVKKATIPGFGVTSLKELVGCKFEKFPVKETDPDKIHRIIADNFYSCWSNYGQEKLHFLKEELVKEKCFPCAKITFEKEISEEKVNSDTLYNYINEMPKYKALLDSRSLLYIELPKIDKGTKLYFVTSIFTELKEPESFFEALGLGYKIIGENLVLGHTGAEKIYSLTIITDKDELSNHCQEIA